MDQPHHRTPPTICPVCGHKLDCASPAFGKDPTPPKEDDISVCIDCATILIFNKDLSVRAMTDQEWDGLHPTVKVQITKVQFAIAAHKEVKR